MCIVLNADGGGVGRDLREQSFPCSGKTCLSLTKPSPRRQERVTSIKHRKKGMFQEDSVISTRRAWCKQLERFLGAGAEEGRGETADETVEKSI